jgi:hypothetical protein
VVGDEEDGEAAVGGGQGCREADGTAADDDQV